MKCAKSDKVEGGNFKLEAGEFAEVAEVNGDGLFKLKDPRGNIGDGFLDPKFFVYLELDKACRLFVSGAAELVTILMVKHGFR